MGSNFKGMDTYHRILQDARFNGKPIGPEHHLYNRQAKEWATKNHTQSKIIQAARTGVSINVKEERDKLKAKIALKASIPAKSTLRDRYEAEQRAKIAKGYETPEWQRSTDDIPSRGNGL